MTIIIEIFKFWYCSFWSRRVFSRHCHSSLGCFRSVSSLSTPDVVWWSFWKTHELHFFSKTQNELWRVAEVCLAFCGFFEGVRCRFLVELFFLWCFGKQTIHLERFFEFLLQLLCQNSDHLCWAGKPCLEKTVFWLLFEVLDVANTDWVSIRRANRSKINGSDRILNAKMWNCRAWYPQQTHKRLSGQSWELFTGKRCVFWVGLMC